MIIEKIYIVTSQDNDACSVCGAFTTEDKAKNFIEKLKSLEIFDRTTIFPVHEIEIDSEHYGHIIRNYKNDN
jgi:hypothetical protein